MFKTIYFEDNSIFVGLPMVCVSMLILFDSIIPYINSGSRKETWNMVRRWHTARFVWMIRLFRTGVIFHCHKIFSIFLRSKILIQNLIRF